MVKYSIVWYIIVDDRISIMHDGKFWYFVRLLLQPGPGLPFRLWGLQDFGSTGLRIYRVSDL